MSNCTTNLYCGEFHGSNNTLLHGSCPFISPDEIKNSSMFNFGISIDALQSRVVEEHDFPKKFFYCFWWGLRNLRLVCTYDM